MHPGAHEHALRPLPPFFSSGERSEPWPAQDPNSVTAHTGLVGPALQLPQSRAQPVSKEYQIPKNRISWTNICGQGQNDRILEFRCSISFAVRFHFTVNIKTSQIKPKVRCCEQIYFFPLLLLWFLFERKKIYLKDFFPLREVIQD